MDPWRASMIDRKAVFGFTDEELLAPKKQKEEAHYERTDHKL